MKRRAPISPPPHNLPVGESPDLWRNPPAAPTFDLFESAFEYAAIGMAIIGIDYHFLRVNRALSAMTGYGEAEFAHFTFPEITHPDDLEKVMDLTRRLYDGEINTFHLEQRYIHKESHLVWANLSVSLARDEEGVPLFFLTQIQDITEAKRTEEALRLTGVRFAKLIENFQGGLLMEDEKRQILMVNQAYCDMFGISTPPQSLIGQPTSTIPLANIADPSHFLARVRRLAKHQILVTNERILMRDGRVLERDYTPISDNKVPLGHLWLYRDITDRVRAFARIEQHAQSLQVANSALERMALTDELTGSHNRRAFMQRLEEEVAKALKHGTVLSLLITDIDHFKLYNDDFGHPAGDVILREVAWILNQYTRDSDYVARYGGEEFAVILPSADYHTSLEVGERLRRAVASHSWLERPLTASFGLATAANFDPQASVEAIANAMIAVADDALYRAKRAGRNCVVHANDF